VKLLEGKTVLVTGASTGIGRAAAVGAAKAGADVVINYHSRDDEAAACVAEIEAAGQRGLAIKGDVAAPETATEFVAKAVEAFGKVDVMVSNAGICPFHSFLDMPVETVQRTVQVNLLGGYFMCQAAANQMVRQGHGSSAANIRRITRRPRQGSIR
jgi:L-rhamnose 1-dehydrogenase